jgi:hypothetical protein
MFRLEPFELVEQRVELLVGDLGLVQDVVTVLVMSNLLAELGYALERIHFYAGDFVPWT